MKSRGTYPVWHEQDAHATAFTLMEVLVAIILLATMVLIVSNVLSQSSKVVTFSESKIRQNNTAAALADALQDYPRKASKNGVLCIYEVGGRPRLALTTAGVSPSLTGVAKGTASFACLGMVDNQADPNGLLWLPTYVLSPPPSTPLPDVWWTDFAFYQDLTRRQVNDVVINDARCSGVISNLRVPPNTIGDVALLWQVAATGLTRLTVQWTDGTRSGGNLVWYGRDINGLLNAKDPSPTPATGWMSRGAANLDDTGTFWLPEYNDGTNGYRAIWTHHNQNNWPKAIKIRFTLCDPSQPPGSQASEYEVIGTIGQ